MTVVLCHSIYKILPGPRSSVNLSGAYISLNMGIVRHIRRGGGYRVSRLNFHGKEGAIGCEGVIVLESSSVITIVGASRSKKDMGLGLRQRLQVGEKRTRERIEIWFVEVQAIIDRGRSLESGCAS